MTPMALDLALTVPHEIQARRDEVDRMRCKQVELARYEADLAQRRSGGGMEQQTPRTERGTGRIRAIAPS